MSHQPNNIFAGTQVVSLVEVRGPSHSLVHLRGAAGVVTRTPAMEGENFLVRFPDGFEKSLEHSQIEVLKHLKDRLGDSSQQNGRPDSGFDLESVIIYHCVVGSRAYGLGNDEPDTDRRGIYLAPAELQWSLFGAPEQFEDNWRDRNPDSEVDDTTSDIFLEILPLLVFQLSPKVCFDFIFPLQKGVSKKPRVPVFAIELICLNLSDD